MSSFTQFQSSFKGDIVTPDHPEYEKAILRWAVQAVRRAKIVAFVRDEDDVSRAIKYATAEKLPLAIRGGGHSTPGASSSEGGLVIDLSRFLNGVRIDSEKRLAYVGGGALWGAVDNAAIKFGLATVGGTVNHTGVGGLTLGGGFGYLSSAHGHTIDNLVQAKMVLANGSIVTANETENEDLFWAIRGGGSNFGVCTEFVFRLHEQRKAVYAGILAFPGPLAVEAMKVTEKWLARGFPSQKETLFQVATRLPTPERTPIVAVIVFHNGSEEEGRKVYKDFLDLNPIDHTKEIPYELLNTLQNAGAYHGQYNYEKGASIGGYDVVVAEKLYERFVAETEARSDLRVMCGFVLMNHDKISSVPSGATAFNNRVPHVWAITNVMWDDEPGAAEKGQGVRELARRLVDVLVSREVNPEDAKDKAYAGFIGDEDLSVSRSQTLFGDNYPRLQQLKKKYDPELLFNKWYPIEPARCIHGELKI
ncbi:FAD-binding domain-containing protein [Phellopilus nigrolimitatus]|nr:FAD-binding domain-containing protein [Phellopilus nigrolimitatus]